MYERYELSWHETVVWKFNNSMKVLIGKVQGCELTSSGDYQGWNEAGPSLGLEGHRKGHLCVSFIWLTKHWFFFFGFIVMFCCLSFFICRFALLNLILNRWMVVIGLNIYFKFYFSSNFVYAVYYPL